MHGGGYLAGYSGRIDHAWGARTDVANNLPKPPTEYLKKVYFDTVVFTEHQLEYLIKVFGVDHILMGTDYPFDMADYDPVGHVVNTESLDAKTVAAICGGNAKKLLGFNSSPLFPRKRNPVLRQVWIPASAGRAIHR